MIPSTRRAGDTPPDVTPSPAKSVDPSTNVPMIASMIRLRSLVIRKLGRSASGTSHTSFMAFCMAAVHPRPAHSAVSELMTSTVMLPEADGFTLM